MTTKSHNQLCAVCSGTLEATILIHEEKRGTHISLFQNVPAKICSECREMWIDEAVLQEIDRGGVQLTPMGKPPPLAVRLEQALPFRR